MVNGDENLHRLRDIVIQHDLFLLCQQQWGEKPIHLELIEVLRTRVATGSRAKDCAIWAGVSSMVANIMNLTEEWDNLYC